MLMQLDFQEVKEAALDYIPEIVEELGLEHKEVGNEIQILNPRRQDNEFGSASINRETGVWADFAEDDARGDILDFVKYILDLPSIRDAAEWLMNFLEGQEEDSPGEPANGEAMLPAQTRGSGTSMVPTTPVAPAGLSASEGSTPPVIMRLNGIDWRHVPYEEREHPKPYQSHPSLGRPTRVFPYHCADGKVDFFVYRFDLPNGKEIRPLTLWGATGGFFRWFWKGLPDCRVLYNLLEIIARPDAPVVVVEGEKAAEAARILLPGYVVTTSANGSKSPKKTDWSPLTGRNILLWPDTDRPGEQYVRAVAGLVNGNFRFISFQDRHVEKDQEGNWKVAPSGAPEGYDAADLLQEGITPEEFGQLLPDLVKDGVPGGKLTRKKGQHQSRTVPKEEDWTLDVPVGSLEYQLNQKLKAGEVADFCYKDGKVMAFREEDDGSKTPYPISSLFYLDGRLLNQYQHDFSYILHIKNPRGGFSEYILPAAALFDRSDFRRELAGYGMTFDPGSRTELINFIQGYPCQNIHLLVDTIGWTADGKSFILPSETIIRTDGEEKQEDRHFLPPSAQSFVKGFHSSGTLDEWMQEVALPCQGNRLLEMALYAPFLPPLLHPLGLPNFGVHFFGETSRGKTTALRVGCSVLGDPEGGMKNSWRTTDNALESLAHFRNDALLILDELNQATPQVFSDAIYLLGNGVTKARSRQDGSGRPVKTFRLGCLSSGETSAAEFLRSENGRALGGQAVRLLDFSIDAGRGTGVVEELGRFESSAALVRHLDAATRRVYGAPFPAFTQHLVQMESFEDLSRELVTFRSDYLEEFPIHLASPQVTRILDQFVNIAFAGELAIRFRVLPFPPGQAKETMTILARRYLDHRGGLEGSDVLGVVDNIRRQISDNRFLNFQQVVIQNRRYSYTGSLPPRKFWGYALANGLEDTPIEFMIPTRIFKEEFCRGVNHRDVIRAMHDRQWLESTEAYPFGVGRSRSRCYHILPAFLGEEQVERQS